MNQIKTGAVLNYVVIVLNTLVGLLYTPYMLHMMGQNEYGLYSLVASVISYLTIFDFGLGNAVIRYTAKYRAERRVDEQSELLGMFLALYLGLSVLALLAGGVLYINVDSLFGSTMALEDLDKARIMMLILVLNLAFTFPMSIFGSVITAYERFAFPKIVNIVRIILNTVVMIVLLRMGYKAVAMVVVQTVFNVVSLIINYCYCKVILKVKIRFSHFNCGLLKEVAIYSFWVLLTIIMDKVYWSTGQFVLGIVSGTAAVAVFSLAVQLQNMNVLFSTAISGVLLPKVTGMVASNNTSHEISSLFIRTGRIQNIVMSLILFGFIVFGKQFINLWAGEEYWESYLITVLFFIAIYADLIQNIGISILQARNQMKFRSLLLVGVAGLSLICQFILAKKMGGIGCAIAVSGALLCGQGIIMNIYYYKKQNIDIALFWKEILRMDAVPLLISAIFYIIVLQIEVDSWPIFALCIFAFLLVYCPLTYMFSLNKEEKKLVIKCMSFFRH